MPLVDLDAIPQVPLDFITSTTARTVLLNALARPSPTCGPARRAGGVVTASGSRHTEEHFGREDRAMQQAGFPPYPMHHGEHVRVLAELAAEGRRFTDTGDAVRLDTYVTQVVPTWFVNHIQTMDLMTARFVSMQVG
jgi:hemerythrin